MAYSKIVYRVMVAKDAPPEEYPQTADQAALAIGIHYVTGHRIEREEPTTHGAVPVTLVSVYGSTEDTKDVLFGVYEFHGRM